VGFLFARSSAKGVSLISYFLIAVFYFLSNLLCKHLVYNQAGLSNRNNFFISQLPVLTMMLERSQAVPSRRNGDSRINKPSWVPQKHTPCLYPRHKQDLLVPLLSRGLGPRPSSDSKPPTLQARPQYGA
jgi:hypothetical protein